MSEPIKPRIDFDEPLQPPQEPALRAGVAFDAEQAESFFPAAPELQQEEEEGRAEGIINAALKPKRSLWRKMVTAGLALFGVSVVAQGVQWVHTAWVQQDWIAMGGGVAGGLIVFAGVGSVVTEWRRLYRLRQRAEERDVARELLHSPEAAGERGIHMSRLYLALDELTQGELTAQRIGRTLQAFLDSQPEHSDRASLSISGELLLSRPALLSPQRGWKAYPLRIEATLADTLTLALTVGVPYSSTCPSSAALSRQLAQQQFQFDFEQAVERVSQRQVSEWLLEQGMPATPHSQRSWAWITVTPENERAFEPVKLIDRIEHALGTPVQTLVKRRDEQAFALANGQNLMFCEDAARRLYGMLRSQCDYRAFSLRVEHQESLHAHNAVAELSWRGEHHAA